MAPALRMTRSIKEKLKIFLRVRSPPAAGNFFGFFSLPFLGSINENASESCIKRNCDCFSLCTQLNIGYFSLL